jgi:type VI secretion system VasD/TssJ family lipoprotein
MFISVALLGCAKKLKDDYRYIKDAVVINMQATANLNTFNNQSHTVVLVLYELSNPNIFNQMLEDPDGVVKLLEGTQFDSSVLSRRRLVVQPEEERVFSMDRVEGARYLGVVAGFYSMQGPENFSRLFALGMEQPPSFFWARGEEPHMDIKLRLGADGFIGPAKSQQKE